MIRKGGSEGESPARSPIAGIEKRIIARRKQLGLTQEQLAERSGLSPQFFSSVETGKKNIRAENVVRLSQVLGVSTDYLLTGRHNSTDIDGVASLLWELDEPHLRCAETILKSLVEVCKRSDKALDHN